MSIARTLGALHIYDILANLIPGSTLLLLLLAIVRVQPYLEGIPTGLLTAGLILGGFTFGHVIQAIASKLDGKNYLFGDFVATLRDQPADASEEALTWVPEWIRAPAGFVHNDPEDIRVTEVEEQFWPLAREYFGLSDEFAEYGRLMELLLSYLETVPATRALRFQSIHTFHRSMWATSILGFVLTVIVLLGTVLGIVAGRPLLWLGVIAVVLLAGVWMFGSRKEKFNRKFVQYTIVDFYVEQQGESSRP